MDGLLRMLCALCSDALPAHRLALCRDVPLLPLLGRFTAACHTALPAWVYEGERANARSLLLTWVRLGSAGLSGVGPWRRMESVVACWQHVQY